ncbi:MAG: lysine--tRNA ligase [Tissierellia bacterium]|nr:lysine--tRNA ligase [Tissierellia bacterium]
MEQNINEMLQIKRDKLEELKSLGKDPHRIEKVEIDTQVKDILDDFEGFEGKHVKVAGRILAKRGHGKINFMELQDSTARIQLFNKLDQLGSEKYAEVKKIDVGDLVHLEGQVIKTQTGQITILTQEFTLLTKSLQILPEKWHGLKDMDLRYRQRYVDMIMNPEVKDVFRKRTKILSSIRHFLDSRGFLEVETPILNTIAGGANARPFITHHNTLDIDMYLRIANELYLKRLIVGGFDKVYEMGRMFRNEGMDATHNPEYTAMELYQAYVDYKEIMVLMEELIEYVAIQANGSTKVNYQGTELDFKAPWQRITMVEAIKKYSGVDFDQVQTDQEAIDLAKEHGIDLDASKQDRGHIIVEFFEKYCEEKIVQPTFVYQYPVEVSPLAKRNPEDPRMTQRFEAFVLGKELGNAFSELNDASDQRKRFEAQVALREKGDDEAQMMDTDFINALEVGLPPTGGLGIGIDRLVMFLTNQTSIRDVLLFPTMKPLTSDSKNKVNPKEEVEEEKIDFSKIKVEPLFEEYVDFESFSKSDFRVVKVKSCEEVPKSKKLLKFTLDDGSENERTILSGIKEYYSPEELVGKTLVAITNLPPRKMMGIESQGMLISAVYEYDGEEKLNLIMLDKNIPAGAKLY